MRRDVPAVDGGDRARLRVVVVSANRLYRAGLVQLLERSGFTVSGVASLDEIQAVTDVAVVDGQLPSLHTLRSLAGMRVVRVGDPEEGAPPGVAVVDPRRGVDALIALLDGPDIAPRAAWATPAFEAVPLTPRENDVLRLVADGRTSAAIAHLLGISVRTVDNHKRQVFRKLGVHSQAQAVACALRAHLIPIADAAEPVRRAEMVG